jgi:caffeoyl-CoA O-methyltransferase
MTNYTDQVSQYITQLFAAEDEPARRAREDSPRYGLPAISIQPEEGRLLQMLAAASGGRLALEIGTLGGYSGTWIARGLAEGGRLITLEVSEKHAQVARRHFEAAGVGGRVEILVGDAHQQLGHLGSRGAFDMVFIDAEKTGYAGYYAWAVEHVRLGGIICAHNALRGGRVAAPSTDPDVTVMQEFNAAAARDARVISTLIPTGDGTLVAVRVR